MNSDRSSDLSLKFENKFTTLGCKDIGIGKLEFVTNLTKMFVRYYQPNIMCFNKAFLKMSVFTFKKYLGKRWIGFRGGGISISVSQDL